MARIPLFDRLVDERPWEAREVAPLRVLDRDGLVESVRGELQRLFNTRSPVAPRLLEELEERTVLDYGVPDFLSYAPRDPEARSRLAAVLATTVRAYEPRLLEPRVAVEEAGDDPQGLAVVITGHVRVDGSDHPVSFPVAIAGAGEVRVRAN